LTMMEVTLGAQSNRLNRQMRLLTAVSITFMPLTLITGIYGMNFDNMPELHWEYGYFYVLATITIIAISSIVFLIHRKWL
nr:magnesium and cobalt transport protein CorA [Vitreoscilla sp.]